MAGVARAVRERRARLGLNLTEWPFYTPPPRAAPWLMGRAEAMGPILGRFPSWVSCRTGRRVNRAQIQFFYFYLILHIIIVLNFCFRIYLV
jgi:hypothetical protein